MTDTTNRRGEPATVRVAMWSSRHRWPVAAAWFIGTIAVLVLSALTGGIHTRRTRTGAPTRPRPNRRRPMPFFDQGGTGTPTEDVLLVVSHPQLKVTDPAFASFVAEHHRDPPGPDGPRKAAQTVPVFATHPGPGDGAAPGRAGRSRPVRGPHRRHHRPAARTTVDQLLVPVRPAILAIEADGADKGFAVHTLSPDADQRGHHDPHQQQPRHDLRHDRAHVHHPAADVRRVRGIDRPARPRDHRAAGGLPGSSGVFEPAVAPVSPYATQLIILIGLAVSVDYSLFMITRFRSERRAGRASSTRSRSPAGRGRPAGRCSSAASP